MSTPNKLTIEAVVAQLKHILRALPVQAETRGWVFQTGVDWFKLALCLDQDVVALCFRYYDANNIRLYSIDESRPGARKRLPQRLQFRRTMALADIEQALAQLATGRSVHRRRRWLTFLKAFDRAWPEIGVMIVAVVLQKFEGPWSTLIGVLAVTVVYLAAIYAEERSEADNNT